MKRESGRSPIHHFSFGERFDEKMLRVHPSGGQCVMLSIHHFIRFSPLIKSNGKATEVNTAIRRLVGRTSILPTDRKSRCRWRKEKGIRKPPTLPQAFGEQKAIAH